MIATGRQHGSTSNIEYLVWIDSEGNAETDGTPDEALGLFYTRRGGSKVEISLAAGAWGSYGSAGDIVLSVNDDGVLQLSVPDAAYAAGADEFLISGYDADGGQIIALRVPLTPLNTQDSVRLGMTSLPNAAADAAGGLPISDAGGLDMDALAASNTTNLTTESTHIEFE